MSEPFETLKKCPFSLKESQCVFYEHELLICGALHSKDCYSYHTLKKEYRFICKYPKNIELIGHCVVKIKNNKDRNEITLLSFGGPRNRVLIMKYVSIWSNISNKSYKLNNYNQWIQLKDNYNNPIHFESTTYYSGSRAVSETNNDLLFIASASCTISVFDLNTLQFIKNDNLPLTRREMGYGCFDYQLNMMKIIILFNFINYLFVEVFHNSLVLEYLIPEKKWVAFKNTLPCELCHCTAILNEKDKYIYIIGGYNGEETTSVHMRTKVREWDPLYLVIIYLFIYL
ncbi:hypothetical protein RFI_31324 [Reticulomyxa filosa]|uniref:Uncharacterized protein n=1 Tax=Reticulomyxa filosa TaxID=46433 RepID=X6LY43_RETFI|nr:hypothetical protein RFI_31324 [Reticulomyxa filosa]|eukprot:ETO06072.1 hypothetical protein RFI_31324 [Reticulomyxa filosa]